MRTTAAKIASRLRRRSGRDSDVPVGLRNSGASRDPGDIRYAAESGSILSRQAATCVLPWSPVLRNELVGDCSALGKPLEHRLP